MKAIIVIPAHLASQRLPGKPLLSETGKPLVIHTYEAAKHSRLARDVFVATGDDEIIECCQHHGAKVLDVVGECRNGTVRTARAVLGLGASLESLDAIINLQCDEPRITGAMLDQLISRMARFSRIATLTAPLEAGLAEDPHVVKVAVERRRCQYFSRAKLAGAQHHIGCYAFRPGTLLELAKLPQSGLSAAERLEQLDWLADGQRIDAVEVDYAPLAINCRADYDEFIRLTGGQQDGPVSSRAP